MFIAAGSTRHDTTPERILDEQQDDDGDDDDDGYGCKTDGPSGWQHIFRGCAFWVSKGGLVGGGPWWDWRGIEVK